MSYRGSILSFAFVAALVAALMAPSSSPAADDAKYPDWKGQWIGVNFSHQIVDTFA